MANRLSYSQLRLYQECGQKYKYYYKDKLREKVRSGALCFGEAVDKAFEGILKDPSIDDKQLFDTIFSEQEINKRKVYLPESTLVVYSSYDYDQDLLTGEDIQWLEAKGAELGLTGELDIDFKECLSAKKQARYKPFRENQRKFFNLCNWYSLRRKGHVMLESFREKVLPQVEELEGTQVKIELTNDNGDTILGAADFVGKWKGTPGRIVLDFKTSSIEYADDSVVVSPQLTLYAHSLGISQAGYVVFSKRINKNKVKTCSQCGHDGTGSRAKTCDNEVRNPNADLKKDLSIRCSAEWTETIKPEAEVKVIISDIPKRTEEIVLENAQVINEAINKEVYVRNLQSCKGPFGMCAYYNLCYKNDKKDLEEMK